VPADSFDFLGYTLGQCYRAKTGEAYVGTRPSKWKSNLFPDQTGRRLEFGNQIAILRNSIYARTLVWVFNVFGTLDLLDAITLATVYGARVQIGGGALLGAVEILNCKLRDPALAVHPNYLTNARSSIF
jgi:hypothetical protein